MSARERHSRHDPPIDNERHAGLAKIELEERCLDLLDALIAAHGNDNETGCRADIAPQWLKDRRR